MINAQNAIGLNNYRQSQFALTDCSLCLVLDFYLRKSITSDGSKLIPKNQIKGLLDYFTIEMFSNYFIKFGARLKSSIIHLIGQQVEKYSCYNNRLYS